MQIAPEMAVDDSALGFWGGVRRDGTRHQRWSVHKTLNVLQGPALGAKVRATMKMATARPIRASAEAAINFFAEKYHAKCGPGGRLPGQIATHF